MAKVKKRKAPATGTKKKSGGKKPAASTGARGPTGRPEGKTTGLGVHGAWCHIFQQNEKVGKAKRLTDEQIYAWMKKEFPGRETKAFASIQGVRTKYNKGGLTGGEVPKVQSKRYDEKGDHSPSRVGRPAATAPKAKGGKSRSKRGKAA